MRRAALGRRDAFGAVLAGLVYSRINTCKSNDGAAARKTAHIADLSHRLSGCRFTDAIHGSHSIVLRQLHRKARHLSAQSGNRAAGAFTTSGKS